MPNLYLLTNEMQDLYEQLMNSVDEDTGEIDPVVYKALDVKKEEFEAKAINVATVVRMFTARKAEVKAEIARLQGIDKQMERVIDSLTGSLSDSCLRLGYAKIDGLHAKISFRKSEQTIIDNLDELPDDYKTCEIKYSANKTKIKDAIKSGQVVAGAHLETVQNIQIR